MSISEKSDSYFHILTPRFLFQISIKFFDILKVVNAKGGWRILIFQLRETGLDTRGEQ